MRGSALVCLQIENQGQGVTDSLHLLESQEAGGFGETVETDRRELIAHDQGRLIGDLHDWPEGGLASTGTGERDDPRAEGQPVGLQHDRIAATPLLVPFASRWQPIDLTPHGARPCPAGWRESR